MRRLLRIKKGLLNLVLSELSSESCEILTNPLRMLINKLLIFCTNFLSSSSVYLLNSRLSFQLATQIRCCIVFKVRAIPLLSTSLMSHGCFEFVFCYVEAKRFSLKY